MFDLFFLRAPIGRGSPLLKILYMANRRSRINADGPFVKAVRQIGDLEIKEQCRDLSEEEVLALMRGADVIMTIWGAKRVPVALATDPGRVRYVINLSGSCRECIPPEIVDSPIAVTNWGTAPANVIAEGAMALFLAVLKDLRGRTRAISAGEWAGAKRLGLPSGSLKGLKVGLYGCGAIGRRFVELILPFKPKLYAYDPFAVALPEGCERVDSLEALFEESEAMAVHAGLSDETRGSVTAELLSLLPDHGVIINVARGEIIDQDALFAELKTGRLRAGLDVLAGNDSVPADHECRQWPNLLMTCHDINSAHWPERPEGLSDAEEIALENLKRFASDEPLHFLMDSQRYALSS